MNKWIAILFIIVITVVVMFISNKAVYQSDNLCTAEWKQFIEETVSTGDGMGHGPDLGSDEWQSVIEAKLSIRGDVNTPQRTTKAWCSYIDKLVRDNYAIEEKKTTPSFPCDGVKTTKIETFICEDKALSILDRKLSDTYIAAAKKVIDEQELVLKADQRGWIKGRNECWKSENQQSCIRDAYLHRRAALQAKYNLVPDNGTFHFICDDDPTNEVVVTFFQTTPSTLIASRGESISLMYIQPSASGSMYQGRNEIFWEHHGEAFITWGYGTPEMNCKSKH